MLSYQHQTLLTQHLKYYSLQNINHQQYKNINNIKIKQIYPAPPFQRKTTNYPRIE